MRILVVEDEADIRGNVMRILRMEGFEVLEAENGRIGLDVARAHRPDLVLSDIMMPELDGYGLLEALRADPLTAATPFIFLSARADRSDRRKGMNLGADDYLGKPFSRDELMDAVWARMKRIQAMGLSTPPTSSSQPGALSSERAPVTSKGYNLVRHVDIVPDRVDKNMRQIHVRVWAAAPNAGTVTASAAAPLVAGSPPLAEVFGTVRSLVGGSLPPRWWTST